MADPTIEDEGFLREWAPLNNLLQQIPLKAQRGIFTYELNLTCMDALSDFIAVGTNLGLVYWYSRKKDELQRLRCENTASAITCVKVVSTVDYMVAVGNENGMITVFQIPKEPPDSLPESMKPRSRKQVERYTINGLHTAAISAMEWSLNGVKLFSGDKNGTVVLTELDFYMHLTKSIELLNEKYEIVQLSYSQQLLLVSTTYRSIVCHREDRWRVAQVGQKERKSLGKLGATFCNGSGRPQDLIIYASRPGLRLWLADKNGVVQQTLIYKETMMREHRHVPLINPIPTHMKNSRVDHTFGPLRVFKDNLLVTYSQDTVYVLNPTDIYVVATVADLRRVQDVAVTKDEIFILEGDRSIIRVAYLPENILEPGVDSDGALSPQYESEQPTLNDVFLIVVGTPEIQRSLVDSSKDKNAVWEYVATEMSEMGYPFGEGEQAIKKCEQKWNHMSSCFKKFQRTNEWDCELDCALHYETLNQIFESNRKMESDAEVKDEHLPESAESPSTEPQTKKLKLVCDQGFHSDSLSGPQLKLVCDQAFHTDSLSGSQESQCSESSELVETTEVVDDSNNVYVDVLNVSEGVYYDDEHITVYPETSNSEILEEFVLPVTDSESVKQKVYIVVTPSFGEDTQDKDISDITQCTKDEKTQDESNYTYVSVEEDSLNDESLKFDIEQGVEHVVSVEDHETASSNKTSQTLRPVPTPAQALMALVTRIGNEERRRDRLRRYQIEKKLEELENEIWKQSSSIQELTETATVFLADLLQEDSSDSE